MVLSVRENNGAGQLSSNVVTAQLLCPCFRMSKMPAL